MLKVDIKFNLLEVDKKLLVVDLKFTENSGRTLITESNLKQLQHGKPIMMFWLMPECGHYETLSINKAWI